MAKIYFIRHAESIANSKGIYQGQSHDTGLSVLGKQQAEALAEALARRGVKKIMSSPSKRTMETANLLAQRLNISVEKDVGLIETNHGDWEGKPKEEIEKKWPKQWQAWQRTPSNVQMPGGEHTSDTVTRAKEVLKSIAKYNSDTAVITHGNIAQFAVCVLDGVSFDTDIKLDSAAYHVIENGNGKLRIVERNEKGHLKGIESDLSIQAW